MLCKNHAPGFFGMKLIFRGVLDGMAAFKFLLSGDANHFFAVLRAHISFYSMLGKMLKKRKTIQKKIKRYSISCVYRRSIVWEYFVKKKKKFSELNRKLF